MIRFALICDQDHQFESWFQSGDAFEKLKKTKMLSCPICSSKDVTKSLMQPRVKTSRPKEENRPAALAPNEIEKSLTKMKQDVEKNSEYVGLNFAQEAREIHLGNRPERAIYGEAKIAEAKSLIADGICVAPLPFIPRRKSH